MVSSATQPSRQGHRTPQETPFLSRPVRCVRAWMRFRFDIDSGFGSAGSPSDIKHQQIINLSWKKQPVTLVWNQNQNLPHIGRLKPVLRDLNNSLWSARFYCK